MKWIAGLALLCACTRTNESHCGNREGDKTCEYLGFKYCNLCKSENDGCQFEEITAPACHDGVAGTDSSSSTSISSSMTTIASTGTSESTTAIGESTTGASPCGNRMIDDGEECDGTDLGSETCMTQGGSTGDLHCTADCRIDNTGCAPPTGCGNDMIDGDEVCDGPDLGGQTCADRGNQFGGDGLACTENCFFDTGGCCIVAGSSCAALACCTGNCIGGLCVG